jgi:cation transport regulator ChaC
VPEEKTKDGRRQIEVRKIEERYYFAYGSNMNLGQMRFRCPDAEVVGNVRLEDYRLAFRGRAPGNGVATVLPEKGSCVDGVLWRITEACEKNLDFYEGFPNFYGKETIQVKDQAGALREVFVYTMNSPHKDVPARPSKFYLDGILEGCLENDLPTKAVMDAVKRTRQEMKKAEKQYTR